MDAKFLDRSNFEMVIEIQQLDYEPVAPDFDQSPEKETMVLSLPENFIRNTIEKDAPS